MSVLATINFSPGVPAEIDKAVALYCGGWALVPGVAYGWVKEGLLSRVTCEAPEPYSTQAGLVMPLLGEDYDVRCRNGQYLVTVYRPSSEFIGYGLTLALAACAAALRAANVRVEGDWVLRSSP